MIENLHNDICTGKIFEKLNSLAQKLTPYYSQDLEVTDLEKTAEIGTISLSKKYLSDELTPALLVHQAAKNLLSDRVLAYEPETIWIELKRLGVEVPNGNRNQLLMVNALLGQEAFIYDAHTFKNIIIAFNDELPNPEISEEVSSEEIAWALVAMQLLRPGQPIYFDYDPIVYTAVVLHREGFIKTPETLDYAQEELDKLNSNKELKQEVENALKDKKYLENHNLKDILEEQLNKLNRVQEYLKLRYKDYQEKLVVLLTPEETGAKIAEEMKEFRNLKERKTSFMVPMIGDIEFGKAGGRPEKNTYVPSVYVIQVFGA